jgi:exopolysaccharide biosynthesis predicted pyruvyltransferase EpsI
MNVATINLPRHPHSFDVLPPTSLTAPEELRRPFDELAKALLQAADDREVILLRNPGNYGNSLARYGTIRFLEDIGLRYRETDLITAFQEGLLNRATDRQLLVNSGSGTWASAGKTSLENIQRQFAAKRNIFILPATFQRFGLSPNIPVFVRDRFESWEVVPHAKFCHDMSFYLALVAPRRLLAHRMAPNRALGLAFRTDHQAREHGLATLPGNVDISASGTDRSDPIAFLRFLDRFSTIATDRLQVAIGAMLLGKRVLIAEGNDGKIKAVFNSSIKGIFDNCDLVQDCQIYVLADSFEQNRRVTRRDI